MENNKIIFCLSFSYILYNLGTAAFYCKFLSFDYDMKMGLSLLLIIAIITKATIRKKSKNKN